jgi:hypothetical protein
VKARNRRKLAVVLLAAATPGCGFLADEFWYVDRAAPVRALAEEEWCMRGVRPSPGPVAAPGQVAPRAHVAARMEAPAAR